VIVLIDGDIVTYRAGFSRHAENHMTAIGTTDTIIEDILDKLQEEVFQVYITGKGNFREEVSVTAPYKGNRKGEKPEFYLDIRQHLLEHYSATLCEGQEADDAIAIAATEYGDECIMASIDKDFDQVPGWHFNFVKNERYYITEEQGRLNFYTQFLVGDNIDNIKGVRGIGPVKAKKLLEDCKTDKEMFDVCVDKLGYDRAVENGILLHLRRHEGEMWTPPL
jgi:5'-3' exonuclease